MAVVTSCENTIFDIWYNVKIAKLRSRNNICCPGGGGGPPKREGQGVGGKVFY